MLKWIFGFFCFSLSIVTFANAADSLSLNPEIPYILNTFFLLFSAALVMWMAAGFCMLESGLVRSKSIAVICLKNIMIYAIACICYYMLGYNLMFTDVGSWIGSFQFFVAPTAMELNLLSGEKVSWSLLFASGYFSLAFVFFQMVFVATTASIISGALAERVKLWSFFIFVCGLCSFIYPVVGAWTWGGGWLAKMGFQDFAGSTVVHSTGGWAALVGVLLVGPRLGKYKKNGEVVPTPASNVPLATLGMFILWFGWLGFNGGSVLSLGSAFDASKIGLVFFNTNLAASAGVILSLFVGVLLFKKVQILLILNGALAGLVAITAAPDIPNPLIALFIGGMGGVLATLAVPLLERWKIDDVVGAIPVHLVGGIWGTIAVGIFTKASILTQIIGVVSVGAFVLLTAGLLWLILNRSLGLRVSESTEILGQDIVELGIEAYPEFLNLEDLQGNSAKKLEKKTDEIPSNCLLAIELNKKEDLQPLMEGFASSHVPKIISKQSYLDIKLCLEEFITNIFDYGYSEIKVNPKVKVFLYEHSDYFIFDLIDNAKPFNLLKHSKVADTTSPLMERPIGGLGISLIKQLSSKLEYIPQKEGNRFKIYKKIST